MNKEMKTLGKIVIGAILLIVPEIGFDLATREKTLDNYIISRIGDRREIWRRGFGITFIDYGLDGNLDFVEQSSFPFSFSRMVPPHINTRKLTEKDQKEYEEKVLPYLRREK